MGAYLITVWVYPKAAKVKALKCFESKGFYRVCQLVYSAFFRFCGCKFLAYKSLQFASVESYV